MSTSSCSNSPERVERVSNEEIILLGEEEPEDEREKSLSQWLYESLGYSKKVLIVLCLGLKDNDNHPLIDIDRSPWSNENKQNVKRSNADLAVEVQHWQKVLVFLGSSNDKRLLQMKPKNKKREALIDWLEAYPITEPHCIEFLTMRPFKWKMCSRELLSITRKLSFKSWKNG